MSRRALDGTISSMERRRRVLRRLWAPSLVLALATGSGVDVAAEADPTAASLPTVSSGARPGPDVLYSAPPKAPQLENRDPRFRADPLLVMGQEAYIGGEYLYQDWIYDDTGSDSGANDSGGSETGGDVDYPTDRARYGGNAADLVEVRIAPGPVSVAYRFTLNTLLVEDSTIVALAFDTDANAGTGRSTLPRDPGFAFPGADEVITTWGAGAEHSRLPTTGAPVTTAVDVKVDLEANQMTVTVPRSVSDPRGSWKAAVAAGLFERTGGGWLRPGLSATSTAPGGAGPLDLQPSGVFNLGFRLDEAPSGIVVGPDSRQSAAIRQKAAGPYWRPIDFAALERGEDRTTVKATGTMSRIFPSRINFGEGKDYAATPELLGQLQPYSIYVPTKYEAAKPVGLTLALHSANTHHWLYNQTRGVQQFGEGRNNIVVTGESRGADGWYLKDAEFDVFEVWNDVARHYSLDPDRTAIAGYSMGGYGAYRLATLYPDLFGRAYTMAAPPAVERWAPPVPFTGNWAAHTNVWLENARHVPFLNAAAALDALVPLAGTRAQNSGAPEVGIRGLDQLGYRFRFTTYPTADHTFFGNVQYDVPYAVPFLGESHVERAPAHVTFTYAPGTDDRRLGLVHDHAYWVSEVQLADVNAGTPTPKATVDVFSHAGGRGDPPSSPGSSAGVAPLPYVEVNRSWGEAPPIPAENKLTMKLTNVGSVVVDTARARLDVGEIITVAVTSSSQATLVLDGRFKGAPVVKVDGEVVPATLKDGCLAISVPAGTTTLTIAPGNRSTVAGRASTTLPATGGSSGPAGWAALGAAILATGVRRRLT